MTDAESYTAKQGFNGLADLIMNPQLYAPEEVLDVFAGLYKLAPKERENLKTLQEVINGRLAFSLGLSFYLSNERIKQYPVFAKVLKDLAPLYASKAEATLLSVENPFGN